uniref:Uncharacterized protein n=1 Tax=Opuntia streptacantha TaxID=393608 RepID=A0A7C9EAT4_OPUST
MSHTSLISSSTSHIIPGLPPRKIYRCMLSSLGIHPLHQNTVSNHESLIIVECSFVPREFHPKRTHHWDTSCICLPKQCVEIWEQHISVVNCIPHERCVALSKQPRFPSFCVMMSMPTEERVVGTQLIPAHQQLRLRVTKKSTNISTRKTNPSESHRQYHGNRYPKVLPFCCIISCPHSPISLTPSKESS